MKNARDNQIRFTFPDYVVWLDLPDNATYGDIARSWDAVASQRLSCPLAVDIKMPEPRASIEPPREELMAGA